MSSSAQQRTRVTAAIATYNGRSLLEIVLDSLERQTYRDLRTVVVDDCSTDETVAWLAERWPQVEVVVHEHNRGVTAALNTCMAAGAESELLLLLNNDVELDEQCVERLVAEMDAHPEAAVAAAKLRDFTRRELLDGTGDVYTWAGFAYRRGQGEIDCGQYDEMTEVFGACGAVALYRNAAFEQVGPFDERFYALCEDADWSFRARLLGHGCRYVPGAVAYHVGSASLGPRLSEFTLYHNWRNQIWMVLKDYPVRSLVRHAPDLLLGQLAMLLVAVRRRCLGAWLRAWRDALRGLPWVLRERGRIQRGRSVDARALEAVVQSGVARARWWLRGSGRQTSAAVRGQPRAASER